MAWFILIIAGLLETVWAAGLKLAAERFNSGLVGLTALTMIASLMALYWSMTKLPLGVAYPIWTGIGSVGSVLIGILLFGQQISASGIIGIILLLAGMTLVGLDTH